MNKDWYLQLEGRRASILIALVVITLATLALSSLRDPRAYDSFWHLRMGQDWVEQGLSPFEDHYSFTYHGEPISAPPYLFQALYFKTADLLGLNRGYRTLTLFSLSLSVVMLLVWLRFVRAPLVICLIAFPALAALLLQRANLRPELFAYPLMILSLILYERARVEPKSGNFLAIAACMLLFTNYHSAILGYVIFFGLFVDLAIKQFQESAPLREWLIWAGWGSLIFLVGFANPDLSHPFINQLSFSEEWYELISEYRSPWLNNFRITLALVISAAMTVILLLRERMFGYAVVCLVFTWVASQLVRIVAPAGIVVLCLFALVVSRSDLHDALTRGSRAKRGFAATVWGVMFIVPLVASIIEARAHVRSNPSLFGYFPDQLVEYMKNTGKEGRVFNEFSIGGYLIYHLAPEVQIYIDGRTNILYPVEHYKRWLQASSNPEALTAEIARHDIDFVILSNRPEHVQLMGRVPGMYLDYADLRYSLYAREDANFPIAGALWTRPWCWDQSTEGKLGREQQTARSIVPEYSLLHAILNLSAGYAQAADKVEFLGAQLERDPAEWGDPTLRIAGYRALELEEYDLARRFFESLQQHSLLDALALGLANLRLGRLDSAEQALQGALQLGRSGTNPSEFNILYSLLVELNATRPLQQIPQSTLDALAQLAAEQGVRLPEGSTEPGWFCAQGG